MAQRPPTTDEERARIDSGQAGDKVVFPDPAAAPLGTDAEAAGYPPTERERRMEQPSLTEPAAPAHRLSLPIFIILGVIVIFAVAVLLIALWRHP
jgi:hypothetical protein